MNLEESLKKILEKFSRLAEALDITFSEIDVILKDLSKIKESKEEFRKKIEEYAEEWSINEKELGEIIDALKDINKIDVSKIQSKFKEMGKDVDAFIKMLGVMQIVTKAGMEKFSGQTYDMFQELDKTISFLYENLRKNMATISREREKTLSFFDRDDIRYGDLNRLAKEFYFFKKDVEENIRKTMAFISKKSVIEYTALGAAIVLLNRGFDRYISLTNQVIETTGIYNKTLRDQAFELYKANIIIMQYGYGLREITKTTIDLYEFMRTSNPFEVLALSLGKSQENTDALFRQLILISEKMNLSIDDVVKNILLGSNTIQDNFINQIQYVTAFAEAANLNVRDLIKDLNESYRDFVILLGRSATEISKVQMSLAKWNLSLRDGLNILKSMYGAQENVIDSLIQLQILSGKPIDFERFFSAMLRGDIESLVAQLTTIAREMNNTVDQLPIFRMQFEKALEGLGLTGEQIATILGKSQEQLRGFDMILKEFRESIDPAIIASKFDELLKPNEWEELRNITRAFFETLIALSAHATKALLPLLKVFTNLFKSATTAMISLNKMIDEFFGEGTLADLLKGISTSLVLLTPVLILRFRFITETISKLTTGLAGYIGQLLKAPLERLGIFGKKLSEMLGKIVGKKTTDAVEKVAKKGGVFDQMGGSVTNLFKAFSLTNILKFTLASGLLVGSLFVFAKAVKELEAIDFQKTATGIALFFTSLVGTTALIGMGSFLTLPKLLIGLGVAIGGLGVLVGGILAFSHSLGSLSENLNKLSLVIKNNPTLAQDITALGASFAALGATSIAAVPTLVASGVANLIGATKPQFSVVASVDKNLITEGDKLIASKLDKIISILSEMSLRETRGATLTPKIEKRTQEQYFSNFSF